MPTDDGKQVTAEQVKRAQDRVRRRLRENNVSALAREMKIPQPTLAAFLNDGKLGIATARRIAKFLETTEDELLNGTQPAGYYAQHEEGLGVGYPKRGKVLDALRHIYPSDVLDEAQAIVLPKGSHEWTEAEWVDAVSAIHKRRQWQPNPPEPPSNVIPITPGHPRKSPK